jgi:hypothetical protein
LGQTLWISDGTNIGFWEITARTSATALTITNRGYTGTPASGTMASGATVQLIGPGIGTTTSPGFNKQGRIPPLFLHLSLHLLQIRSMLPLLRPLMFITQPSKYTNLTYGNNTFVGLVEGIGAGFITYECYSIGPVQVGQFSPDMFTWVGRLFCRINRVLSSLHQTARR